MRLALPKFDNKKALFAYLVSNKADLIDISKSVVKFADSWDMPDVQRMPSIIGKASIGGNDTSDAIERTIIPNTYYWMDSHDDVHIPGIFAKAISEKMPFHLHDHIFQVSAKVGKPIKAYEQAINWRDLGIQKDGQTQALFVDSKILKSFNRQIFEAYKDNEVDQHSVGMMYVRMALAVNDPEYKEEYAEWQKHIGKIGNPERAEEKGYFWAHYEAKLREFSAVLQGSNELTPTLPAGKSTQDAPSEDTQKEPLRQEVDYKQLLQNFKLV